MNRFNIGDKIKYKNMSFIILEVNVNYGVYFYKLRNLYSDDVLGIKVNNVDKSAEKCNDNNYETL